MELVQALWRRIIFVSSLSLFCLGSGCNSKASAVPFLGVTLVAPAAEFSLDPTIALKALGANSVAVIPYAFTPKDSATVIFNSPQQWWGESLDGTEETIRLAKARGLKVMLKPQIWYQGGWSAEIEFPSSEDWGKWQEAYRSYILEFTKIAVKHKVDVLCIGTELRIAAEDEVFFRSLISDIKNKGYQGKLTYAANWDDYQKIHFWDALDFVGIDAYFPLSEAALPLTGDLMKSWKSHFRALSHFSDKVSRPILFTEYGYLSVSGCAGKSWEIEKQRTTLPVNELCQANALVALHKSLSDKKWWSGGFLWKWYPTKDGEGQAQQPDFWQADYTPQGKEAETQLQIIFEENKKRSQ